jgi:hypothetical protein
MLDDYNVTRAAYHGGGVQLPGESSHQALGENTTMSLGGHLLPTHPAETVPGQDDSEDSNGPAVGHGYEDEALDTAERASRHTAQTASASLQAGTADGGRNNGPTRQQVLDDTSAKVRSAVRG